MGKSLSKGTNTNANDRVMTPTWLAKKAIDWAGLTPGSTCYEPCRGKGGFYDLLPKGSVWAEIDMGVDLFEFKPPVEIDLVITNPPYSCMGDFIFHMLSVVKPKRMVLLAPITNLVTKKRLRDVFQSGYVLGRTAIIPEIPKDWPQTGFQHVLQEYKLGKRKNWLPLW